MIPEAIVSLLHHCSKTKAFWHGLSLHAVVLKTGLQDNVFISNHVLNMYAKCGSISLARKLFDEMSGRNLISWSAMISGYDQCGEHWLALDLFSKMQLAPNEYTFASAVSACASLAALELGLQIHAQTLKSGYECISYVSNSLISMYMKCGQCRYALSVYNNVVNPNSVSYNALITGYVENHEPEKGFELFKYMHQQGLVPDSFTFTGLLGFCTESNDLRTGMLLHCQTIKLKLDSNPLVGNVVMAMYAKSNFIKEVEKAFRVIKDRDVISWNTIISAFSHSSDQTKCFKFFREMRNERSLRPDDFTFASILTACASNASVLLGKQIHAYLIRAREYQDIGVSNALVSMYAKSGSVEYAYNLFDKMSCHNLISWNAMIAAFGNHGFGDRAIGTFEQMKAAGVKPDSITFVALLIACNHAGLVDKGKLYFNSMEEKYGITPNIEHVSCLIDMLGRAGRLSEAEEYMEEFHQWNDPIVLGSLLSACRLHGNTTTGERLARQLLQDQPASSSPYVLLSSLYASDEKWDEAAKSRKMLKDSGLRKETGHSLVELRGTYEKFTMGDFSHLKIEEIKHVLRTLDWAVSTISSDEMT
ncbi:pentatricopeptide repeat-containing protein At1g11290, chloroplastic-like [Neltuma alba]|uniref:pentatricopeptide repeat-containing protein At1g11290, chloroplastic-like n=1 Tax=Neltuma alba TaxID=207710 RepID=UPI0010A586A4|nr:pentatricopeptide repeat-containing protein At1g11290, chloroplastic-like [Prosopis alba]XP_028776668.1 pentatricopeptide repeat-containing protein At1g11290, chloroplastic-like [Prosopis alba]